MHPLTKTADVLAELAAGGRIMTGDRPGLLMLVDSGGSAVPAWQTALKAAAKRKPQETVRSQLRLPAELHERLVASSELSGRSMNAEIVHRLEKSLANVVSASEPTGIGDHSGLPPVALAPARAGRTYIAGPMTGLPDFNYPAFNAAAAALRAQGRTVINPADHGVVTGAAWADYVRADLALLAGCETIHLLPGWSCSPGALLEHHVARVLDMLVEFADGAEVEAEGQMLAHHARLNELSGNSEQLAPAIDLEQFRDRIVAAIDRITSGSGLMRIPADNTDPDLVLGDILALIDGQVARHPDDLAVDAFAAAMKSKLAKSRSKGRAGWNGDEPGMQKRLSGMLREHVAKGDPVDVANFAMFLHQRGEGIVGQVSAANPDQLTSVRNRLHEMACRVGPEWEDAAGELQRDVQAMIDGQAGGQNHPDTDRLDFIEGECLAVEAVSVRASEDDADVAWVISQHRMQHGKVVLHRSLDDNLRRAIDAVMQPTKGEGVAGG